jgi:Predicted transcriptional regulator containing an HTH domain and an uncharacterized domain shared with the mammalian protein Schlafen
MDEMIRKPEGRRIEFKETIPERIDLAKTIVAFANDAGGELYIGVKNFPREIIGLPEEELASMKEQIYDIIFDQCYPTILPEIYFIIEGDKYLINVKVSRGNTPPYYLKDKGKSQGTYIRIGSSCHLADNIAIAELERKKWNISFDGEVVMSKLANKIEIKSFCDIYRERRGEEIDLKLLQKLGLIKRVQGVDYPTHALLLLSDDNLRSTMFNYARIECVRFKGMTQDEMVDQQIIDTNIAHQAEEAYQFILRHIESDYPVRAVKEAINNAVIHRDYSLEGKEIKIAVYDDMVEITSPGLPPPSVDYSAKESRHSDSRNRILAPIFRNLGIINQWGEGLKAIYNDLKSHSHIEFRWREIGQLFQVQFIRLNYKELQRSEQMLWQELGQETGQELRLKLEQEREEKTLFTILLEKVQERTLSRKELVKILNIKSVSGHLNRTLSKLIDENLIERTIPSNLTHPLQKFRLTKRGSAFLKLLYKEAGQN